MSKSTLADQAWVDARSTRAGNGAHGDNKTVGVVSKLGSEGEGGSGAIPCKVGARISGDSYNVTLYANGRGTPSTGTGILDVVQVHWESLIPVDTWVVAFPAQLALISGD